MLSFRPVTDDDYEYLYDLNDVSMRRYVEQTYGSWDEDFQRRRLYERLGFVVVGESSPSWHREARPPD